MPKVIIIPDRQVESICRDAVSFANTCQSDFDFYLIPQTETDKSPFKNQSIEVFDGLKYLEEQKTKYSYDKEDLVLTFYNGILKATSYGLSNLFCAGSNIDDEFPCTGIISLKYLNWDILEEKYNYEVQKHSILHLIVCSIIGSYTKLQAHRQNIGCLLDLNLNLTAFNIKLQKGYYLCSSTEFGCYDKLRKEKYGNSIIRLCEKFKTSNYQTIINNIMGDNIQVGNISNNSGQIVIGKDVYISSSKEDNNAIAQKILEIQTLLREETELTEENKQSAITNFDKVREEILEQSEPPNKSKIHKWLTNTKNVLENFVLANHTREAIHWVYEQFHFIIQNIS